MQRSFTLLTLAVTVACGSSSSESSGGAGSSGSSGAAGGSGTSGASGASGASGSGGLTPLPPDPGALRCGIETCTLPGEVCCHESVSAGGVDHCAPKAECSAPSRACDESADCATGELCCTGLAVLPRGATVEGFAATSCVDASSPASCAPEPGVGKSSVPACKSSSECSVGECVIESCYGYPLMTCGGSVDCK